MNALLKVSGRSTHENTGLPPRTAFTAAAAPGSLMLSEASPSDYQKSSVIAEEYSLFPSASPDYGFLGLRSDGHRIGRLSLDRCTSFYVMLAKCLTLVP